MALIKCKECGNEVSNKAASCPKCGAPIKVKKGGGCGCGTVIVVLVVMFIVLPIALSNARHSQAEQPQDTFTPQPPPPIPHKATQVAQATKTYTEPPGTPSATVEAEASASGVREITEPEKKYLSVALGHLATMNEQGTKVAKVMAAIQTGDSTLNDIKDAIKLERDVELMNFQQYYQPVPVPVSFADTDASIQKCYRIRRDAQDELLDYWKDSNNAHIVSGMATYKRSAELANRCAEDLTAKMKTLKKSSDGR